MWQFDANKKDIVIRGWEQGIADSAEAGLADIRNVNVVSIPGEAMANFATAAVTTPPTYSAASVTFTGSTDIVTYTPTTALYNGCSVTFGSTAGGVTAGVVYWVGNLSGSTFKLYPNIARSATVVDLSDSANTMTTITMGTPTHYTTDNINNYILFTDSAGRVWWINGSSNLQHVGPINSATGAELLTNAHGNGLVVWNGGTGSTSNWIFSFKDATLDYFPTDGLTNASTTQSQWVNAWKATTGSSTTSHHAIAAQDDAVYFCNSNFVGSLLVNAGSTFDPTSSSSYTYNASALKIPAMDRTTWLSELGLNLMVGGTLNRLYPWDRKSPSFSLPLILPENNTAKIVTSGSLTYLFVGNRGRIYVTNGASVELFKKIPDQTAGVPDPYYTWGGAMYWKNQLYFGVQATTNAGGTLSTHGGVWAIDLTSNALRGVNTLSYTGYTGSVPVLAPNITTATPVGTGYYAGWLNSSTPGLDVTTNAPYVSTEPRIDTDIIPIGVVLNPRTIEQIEFKLSMPLVSGESVTISYRSDLTSSFTQVGTTTTVGKTSDIYTANFGKLEWIQLRIVLTSTASSPSYTRLTEVRMR